MRLEAQPTSALDRDVFLRPGTADRQVWGDTFTGLYHLPPDFDSLKPPRRILDVGANIGLTAAHYQSLWPTAEVVAVEMDAECCELACRNAPEVTVRHHAVAGTAGFGTYDPSLPSDSYAFIPSSSQGTPVQALTLRQTILRAFGDHPVDLVKMDVEGAEWAILRYHDWVPLVRSVLIELHGGAAVPSMPLYDVAAAALDELGYRTCPQGRHPASVYGVRLS